MYTNETKQRQQQTMLKSTMIAKKSINNMQKTTNSKTGMIRTTVSLDASKTKVMEYGSKSRNQSKSKFTILSQALPSERFPKRLNSATPLSTGKRTLTMDSNKKSDLTSISERKTMSYTPGITNNTVSSYKRSAYQSNLLNQNTRKEMQRSPYEFETLQLPKTTDISTQTNESEILNYALIVGDLKILEPSKFVIDEIDKMRKDLETKRLLKTTRTFEEHSKKDEQHLEDLKEFLDKNYISRKPHRVRNISSEEDRRLIASMDELLQREKPKVESVTDIRERIKQKEQELLTIFNQFQRTTEQFGKPKP